MLRRLLPEDRPEIAISLSDLASCHESLGEYGKAVRLHEEALAMERRLLPEDHPDIATSLDNLATCHERQGKYGKAVLLHEEALAIQQQSLLEDHPEGLLALWTPRTMMMIGARAVRRGPRAGRSGPAIGGGDRDFGLHVA
jgi:tetratricopeptide (TPR) repeat protein